MTNKYSSYLAMERHPNFYQNAVSKKIRYKKSFNGRQIVINCKTVSITEAKQIVDTELIKIFSSNQKQDLRKKKGITNPKLSDLWFDLIEERRPGSEIGTLEGYHGSWEYGIKPFWGELTVRDISPTKVTEYENWYLKENPTRGFFNTGKHLKMLFNYLVKMNLIEASPTIRDVDEIIKSNTKRKPPGRVYTDKEVEDILAKAIDKRTRLGILIYRYMGARKMEILKSKWESVNFSNSTMNIWSYKNKKWREVPIPNKVIGELKAWRESNPDDVYIFSAPRNKKTHLSSQVFDKSWVRTKVLAKIKDATKPFASRIHDLRHTFATQTARDNWPPMVACHVLDMSLKEYQRTYVHISKDDVISMMKKSFEAIK